MSIHNSASAFMQFVVNVRDTFGFVSVLFVIVFAGVGATLLITRRADRARRQECAREFAGARTHYDSLAVKGALRCH